MDAYPEFALNQPKADPRTVLLHKRNFLESSSDHMQDFYKICLTKSNSTPTENSDISKNMCKCAKAALTTKIYKRLTKTTSIPSSSASSSAPSTTCACASSPLLPTASSTALWLSTLVNISKSCHFNTSFIHNYLYKLQKTSELTNSCIYLYYSFKTAPLLKRQIRFLSNIHTYIYLGTKRRLNYYLYTHTYIYKM